MRRLVSIAAAVAVVGMVCLPASASAGWSRPVRATPTNMEPLGGELTNTGVLRLWWGQTSLTRHPARGVALVTRTGRRRAVRRTAIERFVPTRDFDRVPGEYQQPVYLADGRALRCTVSGPQWGHEARTYLLIYSPSGALVKKLLVADQPETYSLLSADEVVAPSCEVTSAGEQAAVMFTQNTATTQQPARQIYLARLLPGDKLSTPVAILATAADQMAFNSFPVGDVSISPTGWVALDWGYDDILKQTQNTVTQLWQWRMTWVAPDGTVSPTMAINPMQGGRPCRASSIACTNPAAPIVNVVGDQKALVAYEARSETIDAAGNASPWTTAPPSQTSNLSSAAGNGTVVFTWEGRGAKVYAARWRDGAWSKSQVLSRPHGGMAPSTPFATVNYRGQAAVFWTWAPFRQNPYFTGWTQAAFNF